MSISYNDIKVNNKYQIITGLIGLLLISSCSNTKLSQTWSSPDLSTTYNDIMVVGISESEQLRRAYETYFSDHIRSRGMESIASYKLIDHESEMELSGMDKYNFRTIVKAAIKGSDIDAVLITHLLSIEDEDIYRPSLDNQPTYYATSYYENMYGYHGYVTTYVQQPGYYTHEKTYILESNLYDVKTEDLVWTTRSRTFSPESMDTAIEELTGLIIDDLVSRKIIR